MNLARLGRQAGFFKDWTTSYSRGGGRVSYWSQVPTASVKSSIGKGLGFRGTKVILQALISITLAYNSGCSRAPILSKHRSSSLAGTSNDVAQAVICLSLLRVSYKARTYSSRCDNRSSPASQTLLWVATGSHLGTWGSSYRASPANPAGPTYTCTLTVFS